MKKDILKIIVLNCILLVFSSFLYPEEVVKLNGLIKEAKEKNPEIISAKKRWEGARTKIIQSISLPDPVISLEYKRMPSGWFNFSNADEKMYSFSQMLPFPTKLIYKGKIANYESKIYQYDYYTTERKVVKNIKQSFWMYYFIHKAIEIYDENINLMKIFSKTAEAKYSVGKASQMDVLKAQVELSKMENMLITLGQEKETAQAMINSILNRPVEQDLGEPFEQNISEFNVGWEEVKALSLKNRPELLSQKATLLRNRSRLKLAWQEFLPDVMLGYSKTKMSGIPDTTGAMISFNIPLWFWKQGYGLKEMKKEKDIAEKEFEAMKNMTLYDIKNILVKTQTSKRLIALYKTSIIPQAEQSLKVSERGYQSGVVNFLDLLDSQRTLLEFKLEYYKNISEYETNIAELERIIGVDLATGEDGGLK